MHAIGMVNLDAAIPVDQFGFVLRFLPPFMPSSRFAGDVDVHTIDILLNLADQFLRQDLFCFNIALGCLLALFAS